MSTHLLSVTNPDIWHEALRFPGGLHAIDIAGERQILLLLKLPHQFLLTCRVNKGFKIYVVPLEATGMTTIGLMVAFFEDPESPLVTWTPLADEIAARTLVRALLSKALTVRLFDEHNRELLAYNSEVSAPLRSRVRLEHGMLRTMDHELAHRLAEEGQRWFCTRSREDDMEAISVTFQSPLYLEDRTFKDERPDLYRFHGAKGFSEVPLVKLEPGQFQEIDIILLLQRIFSPEQIYHAPKRQYDNEEIADVLVITDNICLIVQAKDSPNTEEMLRKSLDRKRQKSFKQLDGGCKQVRGAINYLHRTRPLVLRVEGRDYVIDLGSRNILTLVVVRELFVDEYATYSARLMQLYDSIRLPCIALEYGELIQYATFCDSEPAFVNAYLQVFEHALENGIFPRLRFGLRDLFREDGSFRFG